MSAEVRRQQGQRRGRGARRRSRQDRRRRSRIRLLVAVLVPTAVICIAVAASPLWSGGDDPSAAAAASGSANSGSGSDHDSLAKDSAPGSGSKAGASTKPKARAKPKVSPKTRPSSDTDSKSDSGSGSGSGSKGGDHPAIPSHGPGTFTVARAGATSGGGNAYRVEVEDGTGVDPDAAATQIAGFLAAPRGWAHGGEHTFHQVTKGPAGLVVRIATAATVDKICGNSGLNTHGEVNCRVGVDVMVNLKRWQTGSPEFNGPLAQYRALIINHEVGHWLGHGHETCPGKGRPAPAMMQQIYGLKGCVANPWPYDTKGQYLGGPSVP
ncbi:DUF3152 domain-containing protein [Streptomyces sp. NPDC088727]|uniref:DUF3152 domain-containing protein n=1 Tax=Streptomyces sp. NPDC088727 TaxID=3365875 RepID=UPI0038019BBD